ncbi:MAG: hypothetical protein ACM336_15775 [Acidobacteriota bacterium]
MPLGRRAFKAALSAVLFLGILLAQPAYVPGTHSHQVSGHCCDFCHGRHVPPVQPAAAIQMPRPIAVEWRPVTNIAPAAGEPLLLSNSSRSPPVQSALPV